MLVQLFIALKLSFKNNGDILHIIKLINYKVREKNLKNNYVYNAMFIRYSGF